MPNTLLERLESARSDRFVGRVAEREAWVRELTGNRTDQPIWFVFGPGGIGKSALLREFRSDAIDRGIVVAELDGAEIEASPAAIRSAIRHALGLRANEDVLEHLVRRTDTLLLSIDTFERLQGVEGWVIKTLIPSFSSTVRMVIGGRNGPGQRWMSDPGLRSVTRPIALRNLAPDESREFLAKAMVPESAIEGFLSFTKGYPLALSLAVEAVALGGDRELRADQTSDVLRSLLDRFLSDVPSPAHRAALETCSIVRVTTQPILEAMVGSSDGTELFRWLQGLSFISTSGKGLVPHETAREAVVADLKWRNPDWYRTLHDRAREYYSGLLERPETTSQQVALVDYVYLHRNHSAIKPFFAAVTAKQREEESVFRDRFEDDDRNTLVEAVRRHEGTESQKIFERWLERFRECVTVYRTQEQRLAGFMLTLPLDQLVDEDVSWDPAVAAALQYMRTGKALRPGERATYFRYWMGVDGYQNISRVQTAVFLAAVRHYLTTPGLAMSFFPCANPGFYGMLFRYAAVPPIDEAAFTIGDKTYGVFGQDWRVVRPMAWLELLAKREVSSGPLGSEPPRMETVIVLSRPDFETAVRDALKHLNKPSGLAENPLLRSSLAKSPAGGASADSAEDVLRQLILDAAETLCSDAKSQKYFRAVEKTYLKPAPSQEMAAEMLDLPFSTFRRHLGRGIDGIVEQLWRLEIDSAQ